MRWLIVVSALSLFLVGCGGNPGGGARGGGVKAKQEIKNSHVGHGVVQQVGSGGNSGDAGEGGTTTITPTINLALDPETFTKLFGTTASKNITNPAPAQITAVAHDAKQTGDTATAHKADQCAQQPNNCQITQSE